MVRRSTLDLECSCGETAHFDGSNPTVARTRALTAGWRVGVTKATCRGCLDVEVEKNGRAGVVIYDVCGRGTRLSSRGGSG